MYVNVWAVHSGGRRWFDHRPSHYRQVSGWPQRISSDEKNLITNLKINGEINGTDLRLIREMAGRSVKGSDWEPDEETEGKLSILDLSDAKIVSGGDPYYIKNMIIWRIVMITISRRITR